MKIINIVGARPNFMKIAPLIRAMNKRKDKIEHILVHTGQHYDYNMSDSFFKQLEIPAPDINLEVGSASHAEQTGRIMIEFEKVLLRHNPDLIIVVGDVNSTIACSLVASKIVYPLSPDPCTLTPGRRPFIAHVEAGLRSFDRTMPEEINRILTDAISDFLFITEESAFENLKREGITEGKIHFVGNVMIDTLLHSLDKINDIQLPFFNSFKEYGVITLHRPSNVDTPEILEKLLDTFYYISKSLPLIIPLHPRTKKNVESFGMTKKLDEISEYCIITEPIGYLEMLKLIKSAKMVITDSGGLQEETTFLGIPCITMRDNTERPSTLTTGTNVLVGNDTGKLMKYVDNILTGNFKKGAIPELWDGKSAERILDTLLVSWLGGLLVR